MGHTLAVRAVAARASADCDIAMEDAIAQGEDTIMVPNNVVLSAAVVPLREPDPVDVRVKLGTGISISQVQAILDDRITTPTRSSPTVLLEELDGDEVVVRIQATPERAADGPKLATEVLAAVAPTARGEQFVADGGRER